MKAKYLLFSLLIMALVMGGTGYSVSAGSGDKVTGGGTFINISWLWPTPSPYANVGDKISFGFNAQSQGNGAKGQFHLINHTKGIKAFGTISEFSASPDWDIEGTCLIDGVEKSFRVKITDDGEGGGGGPGWNDKIEIWFGDNTGQPDIKGQLAKGNIQKHKAKVK